MQNDFDLDSVVLVGDRGMISEVQLNVLRECSCVDWIMALKSGAIRRLCDEQAIQLILFDERNLFEFTHADFPEERLTACRNPELAHHRHKTRLSLLEATTAALTKVRGIVERGTLKGADKIGLDTDIFYCKNLNIDYYETKEVNQDRREITTPLDTSVFQTQTLMTSHGVNSI